MPVFKDPDIQDLEDILFGSGAFSYGWFEINEETPYDKDYGYHFPAVIDYLEEKDSPGPLGMQVVEKKEITPEIFIQGIKDYAAIHPTKTYQDFVDDSDAADVDCFIQMCFWGEVRLS